ncbi:sensor histidine kinase [Aestuariispira ectoiniformans]|uniref:sensor histidine kinase n=1 Tax=Aestuariispira ectoiniformans TaxID=2775080 RepID=UPI00223C47B0|nr:HAMP domain-containing sensor histidine kinase [Aestuariispira ectoiniformans]
MTSIKGRLVVSVLAVIVLSTLLTLGITYFKLRAELDELFDENMQQVAETVIRHGSARTEKLRSSDNDRDRLKGEEEFLIQIWRNGRLTYSSLPKVKFPFQSVDGAHTVTFEGQEWRYYATGQGDMFVQVSQPLPIRHGASWEIYSELLIPILLQLPIVLAIIGFFIAHGFKPLTRISNSIAMRNPAYLDRIPESDAPNEVKSMVVALNDLLERLDHALTVQRRFTADAAHELRTPLTAVSLQLDVLRRATTSVERGEAVQELRKGVDRSTRLVTQLLEMARQEPGSVGSALTDCYLPEIAREVIEEYEPLARNRDVSLTLTEAADAVVKGDRNALRVMIGNIVNNAVTYTPPPRVLLRCQFAAQMIRRSSKCLTVVLAFLTRKKVGYLIAFTGLQALKP